MPFLACMGGNKDRAGGNLLFFFFVETASYYVAQPGFKLVILLPQPHECWEYRLLSSLLAGNVLFLERHSKSATKSTFYLRCLFPSASESHSWRAQHGSRERGKWPENHNHTRAPGPHKGTFSMCMLSPWLLGNTYRFWREKVNL